MNIFTKIFSRISGRPENSKTYNLIVTPKERRDRDPLFNEVVKSLAKEKSVYPGMIQKKVKVGYARAVGIMEDLELAGIISPQPITDRNVFNQNIDSYLKNPKDYDEKRQKDVQKFLSLQS